jgi:hypothetical protein
MALDFDSGDQVSVTAAASINSLGTLTRLVWIWFDSFVANSGICGKGSAGSRKQILIPGSAAALDAEVGGASGVFRAQALFTTFTPNITTGKWVCIADVCDVSNAASNKLFAGDLSTLMTEPSAYEIDSGTATTATDDSGSSLLIGTDNDGDATSDAKIAVFAMWNRVLSLAELQSQQMAQYVVVTSGCVCFLNLEPLDLGGLDTQTDLSGNSNSGTPTGTVFSAHPALANKILLPTNNDATTVSESRTMNVKLMPRPFN